MKMIWFWILAQLTLKTKVVKAGRDLSTLRVYYTLPYLAAEMPFELQIKSSL